MMKKDDTMVTVDKPMFSVIIPCYNQAVFLSDALESVLGQSYRNWEAIVVNDGSPDGTETIARGYMRKDTRIKYVYKENGGLSSARNKGIAMALGEFILPLDADDVIQPEYMERAMDAFEKSPQLRLVYCQGIFFGKDTGLWELWYKGYERLLLDNSIFCSAFFRKVDWTRIGGYDENMRRGHEDWEFFIRLLKDGGEVCQIPQPLFNYRIKESSMITMAVKKDVFRETEFYIYSKHRDVYTSYFGESVIGLIREVLYLRKKREIYKSKWYRKLYHQYIKKAFVWKRK